MVYSMTGFGRGEASDQTVEITVEIKSVNHRYNDIILKIPKKFNIFEEKMKSKIKSVVNRGRVEFYLNYEEAVGDNYEVKPNYAVLDQYVAAYRAVNDKYDLAGDLDIAQLTRIPDAFSVEYVEADEDMIWGVIEKAVDNALDSLVSMREVEGVKMKEDVLNRLNALKGILKELEKLSPEIVQSHKQKMVERIQELMEESIELDEQRIAHEVAIFSDKTNIAEEIVRIYSHFEQIESILEGGGVVGRKLDFLIQELNREVNTIGSKSPDIDISNYVIEMKSEIEKIREQIQNIE